MQDWLLYRGGDDSDFDEAVTVLTGADVHPGDMIALLGKDALCEDQSEDLILL
jgi:hypothetical protein